MLINQISSLCKEIENKLDANCNSNVFEQSISFYDATMLEISDSKSSVVEFTKHIMSNYPSVATICVSPRFIEDVGVALGDSPIGITSTIGGFPMGQTYIEVKILECAMAIENGADEVDFVLNVSAVNNGEWEMAKSEIEEIVNEVEGRAVSKVILECGALKDLETLYKASQISLDAGADFIKTSTGKIPVGATLEYVVTMALAIKEFYERSGERRGLKISGGVKTQRDLAMYYTAIEHILGAEWLTPDLYRIGTSSLVR